MRENALHSYPEERAKKTIMCEALYSACKPLQVSNVVCVATVCIRFDRVVLRVTSMAWLKWVWLVWKLGNGQPDQYEVQRCIVGSICRKVGNQVARWPKQCLHLGVLAELRAGRRYPPARASTATQNVEKTFSV